MKIKFVVILIALFSMTYSCKPSVEGEKSQFKDNIQKMKTYSVRFPGTAPYLKKLYRAAKRSWNTALKIKNKDKRAEEMDRINDSISKSPIMKELNNYYFKRKRLSFLFNWIKDLRFSPYADSIKIMIKSLKKDAKKAKSIIRRNYQSLKERSFSSTSNVVNTFDKANSLLTDIYNNLDRKYREVRKKINSLKKGKKSKNNKKHKSKNNSNEV